MAILKAPPQQQKNVTLQLRVSERIKTGLAGYVQFLNCSESYVVSEALKLVFDRDKEFKEWSEKRAINSPESPNEQVAAKKRQHAKAAETGSPPNETATHHLFR